MLVSTGIKEKLSVSEGSEIEYFDGIVRYSAILEANLAKPRAKKKKLPVRHLDPLLKEDYSPPLIKTTTQRDIRPVPPMHLFQDVAFEVGDSIDTVAEGGWLGGLVIKVLENQRYLVALRHGCDIIEIERRYLRPRMYWSHDEWFRSKKQRLVKGHISSKKKDVEVRTEVDNVGYVWAPAIAIKEDEDGTFVVKYRLLDHEDHEDHEVVECTKCPHSKIRPFPPPAGSKSYSVMENVDALLESGWCPGVVSKVLSENSYTVVLCPNKVSKEFNHLKLRPSIVWKDGVWHIEKKVLDNEETPQAAEETLASTHVRVSVQTALRVWETKQNPLLASSNAGDVAEVGDVSVTVNETPLSETTAAPEETKNKENVNKRKRGQPKKFISAEPKQKTGVAGSGSKARTIELVDLTDDDRPLVPWIQGGNLSSGQSFSRTPDIGLNSIVEKNVDVVATPPVNDSTMVLPFAKKSPLWNVIESMKVFKAVPQRPHFSPLLESEEDFREGDAIGRMVVFTGLLEKVNKLQVDDPISSINRIDESFLKLEKHGFDVTMPRSRIAKLMSIKESQKFVLKELKQCETLIRETDSKRRKCEEKIVELQRQQELVEDAKVRQEKVMARMQSHAAVLNQKVQNVDEEFRAIVSAPWK